MRLTVGCLGICMLRGHSRNFCCHKPIFVLSQTATNPANNHMLPTGHTNLSRNAYNLTMNKVILQDLQLQDDWQSDSMLPQLKLLSCHDSQKWASSIKVCFNGLHRLVAKHKMTGNNWAGYGNTDPSQNCVTTLCTVNTANLLHSNVAYILNFNASYGKNISIYYSNKC